MFHASRLPRALAEQASNGTIRTDLRWKPALEAMAKEFAADHGCNVETMSPQRQRLMFALSAMQTLHTQEAASQGQLARGRNGFSFADGPGLRAQENTVPGDIADFTTQQIAYVRDLAEAWVVPEFTTVVPLTGPTGFIHREHAVRANSDDVYAEGYALLEGKDPSYSDCPAPCGEANGVDLTISSELVEYTCKRLKWVYCYPANFQVRDQYGFNLDARLMEYTRLKLLRDVQAEVVDDLVANAGDVIFWDATPPVGTYYETANPDEWQATLYDQIVEADKRIVADPDGRVGGATQVLTDLNSEARLAKLIPFRLRSDWGGPATLNNAQIDAMQQSFGITMLNRYPMLRIPTMADNTMIVQRKDDADPTYVYCPWIVMQSLGMLLDPDLAQVRGGMIHLYAKKVVRPGRIVEIRITPE
jgi:hypothetical protein